MYIIKLLAPTALFLCAESAFSNVGYCTIDQSKPPVVKYYEPGKSCYIEGVFHQSCPKMSYLK